jgi:hypothetical protein
MTLTNYDNLNAGAPSLYNVFAGDSNYNAYWGHAFQLGTGMVGDGEAPQTRIPNTSSFTVNKRTGPGAYANLFSIRYSGNVGIGTTNPGHLLDVAGNVRATGNLHAISNANTLGNIFTTGGNVGIGTMSPAYLLDVAGAIDSLSLTTGNLSAAVGTLGTIVVTGNTNTLGNIFTTGGNVGIGTNSPAYLLDVAGAIDSLSLTTGNLSAATGTLGMIIVTGNSNTLGNIYTTGGNVGIGVVSPSYKLEIDGDIYASGDITAFSDVRLKENIEQISSPLDLIDKMRGVYYTVRGSEKRSMGVIAQEIKEIIPEVVSEKGEYLGVAYGNIIGLLIEAIKDLKQQIEILKN